MRTLSASAIAATLLLAALPAVPQRAEANTGVLRCEMPDGTSVYTNKACSDSGAKASPLEAEVLNRIAREQRHEARLSGATEEMVASIAPRMQAMAAPRPASSGCADSPEQLARDLQASLAVGDVNRVAESFDWAGMQHRQAQPIMDALDRMAGRDALVNAEFFQADLGGGGNAGLMQVTFDSDGATRIEDYEVSANSGCYFLRYA
jgi:hypothetical protein